MTSNRERRLWLLAAAAVVAIWSTLGLARRLADELAATGLVDAAFALGAALVLVVVVAHAVRRRPGLGETMAWLAIGTVYGLAFVRIASPAERTHLVEYGVVAVLVHAALQERRRGGGDVHRPGLAAFVVAAGLGLVDELLQWVLPTRVFDLRDVGFNALAAGMAIAAAALLERARSSPPSAPT